MRLIAVLWKQRLIIFKFANFLKSTIIRKIIIFFIWIWKFKSAMIFDWEIVATVHIKLTRILRHVATEKSSAYECVKSDFVESINKGYILRAFLGRGFMWGIIKGWGDLVSIASLGDYVSWGLTVFTVCILRHAFLFFFRSNSRLFSTSTNVC